MDLLSGTITATFSLQTRLSCYLPPSSPPPVPWICPFLPARISTAYPQPGSGLGPGGLCSARRNLSWLCGAQGVSGIVLLWWVAQCVKMLHLLQLGFAGGQGWLWAFTPVGVMPQNHPWCQAGFLLTSAVEDLGWLWPLLLGQARAVLTAASALGWGLFYGKVWKVWLHFFFLQGVGLPLGLTG